MTRAAPSASAALDAAGTETPADAPTLSIRRTLEAPRQVVFEAFADPKQVDRWFGPDGFRNTTHEHDFRPGGVWRHTMHGPDGTDYPNRSVFVEIDPPERIVWDQGWDRTEFEPMHRSSITLRERGDRTEVELRLVFPTVAARYQAVHDHGATEGGKQTLARLARHVAMKTQDPVEDQIGGEGP